MKLKIMDYNNRKTETGVDLDSLENVKKIIIRVISGDEVMSVLYKDGTAEDFDSSDTRARDYNDGRYILYAPDMFINRIPQFMRRKSSYDMLKWIAEGRA